MIVVTSEAVFLSIWPGVAGIKAYLRGHPELSGCPWRFVKVILAPGASTTTFECREPSGHRTEAWIRSSGDGHGGWLITHERFRAER